MTCAVIVAGLDLFALTVKCEKMDSQVIKVFFDEFDLLLGNVAIGETGFLLVACLGGVRLHLNWKHLIIQGVQRGGAPGFLLIVCITFLHLIGTISARW